MSQGRFEATDGSVAERQATLSNAGRRCIAQSFCQLLLSNLLCYSSWLRGFSATNKLLIILRLYIMHVHRIASETFPLRTSAVTKSIRNTAVASLFRWFLSSFLSFCLSSPLLSHSTISVKVTTEVQDAAAVGKNRNLSVSCPPARPLSAR
jgi:hypothetical protein